MNRAGPEWLVVIVLLVSLASGLRGVRASTGTEESTQIKETVVTATRTPKPRREVGSSMTVITEEQIRNRHSTGVSELLRTVPGLSVSRSGGPGKQTQLRIRGAEANHVLFLVDGIEINRPSDGEVRLEDLTTGGIERIEILRGPQSVLYGSEAAAGVVNIMTKRGEGPPAVSASARAGSFNTQQAEANLSGSTGELGYSIHGGRLDSDGFSAASEDRGNDEDDGYDNNTVSSRWNYRFNENWRVEGVFRWIEAESEIDGFTTVAVDDLDAFEQRFERFGKLGLTRVSDDGTRTHTLAYTLADQDNESFDDGSLSFFTNNEKHKLRYQLDWSLTPAHTLTLGASAEEDDIEGTFTFDGELESQGYYLQHQWDVSDRTFLTFGGRVDDFELFGSEFTYRLTGAHFLEDWGTKLKGNVGTGFKAPTISQLFGGPSSLGNPDLEAEESESWEVGFEQPLLKDHLRVEVVYFDQKIDHLIEFFSAPGGGFTFENLQRLESEGLEATIAWRPQEWIDLKGTMTLLSADRFDASGNEQPVIRRPPQQFHLTADVQWNRRIHTHLNLTYDGDIKDRDFRTFPAGVVNLGDHLVVNLAADYDWNPGWEVFGRIDNAFDEEYEEVFTFGTPERSLYFGLRGTF